MWKIVPGRIWVGLLVAATLALGWGLMALRYPPAERSMATLSLSAFSALSPVLALGLFLGRTEKLWRWSCRCLPKVVGTHDISGTWRGHSVSTFAQGQAVEGDSYERDLYMTITQSWLSVRIISYRPDKQTRSHSEAASFRSGPNGPAFLTVFRGKDFSAKAGEAPSWMGASEMELDPDSGELIGQYCSNRIHGATRATAGSFRLSRVAADHSK